MNENLINSQTHISSNQNESPNLLYKLLLYKNKFIYEGNVIE